MAFNFEKGLTSHSDVWLGTVNLSGRSCCHNQQKYCISILPLFYLLQSNHRCIILLPYSIYTYCNWIVFVFVLYLSHRWNIKSSLFIVSLVVQTAIFLHFLNREIFNHQTTREILLNIFFPMNIFSSLCLAGLAWAFHRGKITANRSCRHWRQKLLFFFYLQHCFVLLTE